MLKKILQYCGIIFICGGSMFVDSQIFSGSWGRNIIGSVIGIILINIKKMLVYVCWWGCKFVGKGSPKKPQTLVPHEQWWLFTGKKRTCTTDPIIKFIFLNSPLKLRIHLNDRILFWRYYIVNLICFLSPWELKRKINSGIKTCEANLSEKIRSLELESADIEEAMCL